jgi:hypothetical protein
VSATATKAGEITAVARDAVGSVAHTANVKGGQAVEATERAAGTVVGMGKEVAAGAQQTAAAGVQKAGEIGSAAQAQAAHQAEVAKSLAADGATKVLDSYKTLF